MITRLLLAALAVSLSLAAADQHTILAVFAHPDDEIGIGPMLAKYAAEGHDVYLVTATSGQVGASNTDIPAGDQLGAAREKELRCSTARLGIHEPFLLRFQDGDTGNRETMEPMRARLREIVEQVKPDVIITFGPDGSTGHPDHRTVGNVATEVFQWRGPLKHKPKKLYYVLIPESIFPANPRKVGLHPRSAAVSDMFITTEIEAGAYLDQVFEAMQCHMTQWGPVERMRQMFEARRKIAKGVTYLRLALSEKPIPAKKEKDVFEGLD